MDAQKPETFLAADEMAPCGSGVIISYSPRLFRAAANDCGFVFPEWAHTSRLEDSLHGPICALVSN